MATLDLTHLITVEREGWESLRTGRGGTFYGRLMTADALMVLVNGMVLDREAVASTLDAAPPWRSYDLSGGRVVSVGEGAAALVYTATASRDGEAEPFVALMSSTYRQVDGDLRLALYQQTTITH